MQEPRLCLHHNYSREQIQTGSNPEGAWPIGISGFRAPASAAIKKLVSGLNPMEARKLRSKGPNQQHITVDIRCGCTRLGALDRAASAAKDVIKSDWTSPEEDQGKGERRESKWKFITWAIGRPDQPVVPVDSHDRHSEIDANGERGNPGEESGKNQQATEEFGESGNVSEPGGNAEAGHKVRMLMQTSEDLVGSMGEHGESQRKTHDQQS
jgi:hypothetical protein